jgi:predicted nucleic acid-binding protein
VIVLDTNVVSEVIKVSPEPLVLDWLESADSEPTAITAITKAELLYGLARLPRGRRKRDLEIDIRALLSSYGPGEVLPFDGVAAEEFGSVVAGREEAGRPIALHDAQIAAICLGLGAKLATRNTKDFDGLDLVLIDPWTALS